MAYKFVCREMGFNCPYVTSAETEYELLAKISEHGKKIHHLTDQQLADPDTVEKLKKVIKKT